MGCDLKVMLEPVQACHPLPALRAGLPLKGGGEFMLRNTDLPPSLRGRPRAGSEREGGLMHSAPL